jgi:hypothetical protein
MSTTQLLYIHPIWSHIHIMFAIHFPLWSLLIQEALEIKAAYIHVTFPSSLTHHITSHHLPSSLDPSTSTTNARQTPWLQRASNQQTTSSPSPTTTTSNNTNVPYALTRHAAVASLHAIALTSETMLVLKMLSCFETKSSHKSNHLSCIHRILTSGSTSRPKLPCS